MGKRMIRSLLGVFLAAAVLLLSAATASAAKTYNDSIELTGSSISGWFYTPSSLPDWIRTVDFASEIRLHKYSWWGEIDDSIQNPQAAESATITFVSGNEALKDALAVEERTQIKWQGEEKYEAPAMWLRVSNDALTEPGTAVFHLSCKSENFELETDIPLIVVSWEDYPLLKRKENIEEVTLKVGESFDGSWAAMLAREERYESQIKQAVGAQTFSGRVDMQCLNAGDGVLEMDNGRWNTYKVKKGGTWDAAVSHTFNNIVYEATVPMRGLAFWIQGPAAVKPGETAAYTVRDTEGSSGRTFTWSLEGEGVTLDAENGTVTAAADAEPAPFVLTAVPSDGQPAVTMKGVIGIGVLADVEFALDENAAVGYSFLYPSDSARFNSEGAKWYTADGTAMNAITVDYRVEGPYDDYAEDPETARQRFGMLDLNIEGVTVELEEEIEPEEGHPARIAILRVDKDGESYSMGILLYPRNNYMARARVFSEPQNGTGWDKLPKVEREDLIRLAEGMQYNHAWAPLSVLDAAITLTTKEGVSAVTAGKKLTFIAAFADPEKVNSKEKNDTLEWSVSGADGAELPAGVSISGKGELTTGKSDAVQKVEVKAYSPIFHVSAVYPVTIIPAAKKIAVEPAELFFYTGTDTAAEVKAVMEPDTVPPVGITWTPVKAGIVEIIPDEETGTATIRPLSGGKTNIAVKEPGGKNAQLTVSVVDPVEDVELAVSGKTAPGGTVTVKATIVPKQAGNKNVEWLLDVGEDIATVSKGKVKIAKGAPVGTKITVTCTALGAPEPVVRTVSFEVTEK